MFRTLTNFWKNNVLDNPRRSRKRMMVQRKKEALKNRGSQHQDDDHKRRNRVQEIRNHRKRTNRSIIKKEPVIILRNDHTKNEPSGNHQDRQYHEAQHEEQNHLHEHPERQMIQRSFSRDSYSTITTAAETPADSHLALAKALALVRSDTSSGGTSIPMEIFVPNDHAFCQPLEASTSVTNFSAASPVLIQSDDGGVEEYLFHGSVLASISQVSPNTPTTADMINNFGEDDNTYPSWLLEGGCWDFGLRENHSSFVSENTNTTLSTHQDDPHLMHVTRLEI